MDIIICDDEKVFISELSENIRKILSEYSIDCNISSCYNGSDLIKMYTQNFYDAVFLDVSMPGIDGFATAKKILEIHKNALIVFVSAQEATVFYSYEYSPVWFVPKHNYMMLELAIKKLLDKIEIYMNDTRYIKIYIESQRQLELDLEEIAYFKTEDHYVRFVTENSIESESFRYKIDNIEAQLSGCRFARVHNRYLVNCRMISHFEKKECILTNGERIPVSRAKMPHAKEAFQNYLRTVR